MSFLRGALPAFFVLTALVCRGAVAATFYVNQRLAAADDRNDGSESHPWLTITRAAAAIMPGDTVLIAGGIYCETVTLTRSGSADHPIRFQAAPAARVIISGANRITHWTRADRAENTGRDAGGNLFSTSWDHDFITWNPTHTHPDDDYHLLIGRCEQVFVAGQPLRQVLHREHLARGTFFVDFAGKRLYAWSSDNRDLSGDDLTCEASARSVLWDCRGDYVQTVGLCFRYAANPAQRGAAIFGGAHDTVEDCVFERTNSVGAAFVGQDITVSQCMFRENGQLGFSADRAHRLLLSDCVVSGNNVKGFSREWEAGGDKLVLCRGVTIARCIFQDNHGTGIWFDIGNEDCTVHNCLIADNEDAGLFYEISTGLHAHDNVIIGNGFAGTPGTWGASCGISLSSSPNCVIERNLIIGNKEGFNFREAVRVTPRIDAAPSTVPEPIWNHDEIVRHNVLGLNRDAQVWGWFDVDDDRQWPAAMQEGKLTGGETRLSLESLKFEFSGNIYAIQPGQDLLHWGTTWKRNKIYGSLGGIQRELRLEEGSEVDPLAFQNYAERDFRLPAKSRAIFLGCYPRGEVPGVRLGTLSE